MKKTVQVFLKDIIDYAGLFPPARLPFNKAFTNYLAYTKSEFSWILSHFIIPNQSFKELGTFRQALQERSKPVTFSVLGGTTDSRAAFEEQLPTWFSRISKAHEQFQGLIVTPTMELKLPEKLSKKTEPDELLDLLQFIHSKARASDHLPKQFFVEVPYHEYWETTASHLIKALGTMQSHKEVRFGFKLRTGGVEPWMVPDIDHVIHALTATAAESVPMKYTAGLHHPLRNYDNEVGTTMYGFLNVFTAGMYAHAGLTTHSKLKQILTANTSKSFIFTDNALTCNNEQLSANDIEKWRSSRLLSFGSCSFTEPIDDLKALHLI